MSWCTKYRKYWHRLILKSLSRFFLSLFVSFSSLSHHFLISFSSLSIDHWIGHFPLIHLNTVPNNLKPWQPKHLPCLLSIKGGWYVGQTRSQTECFWDKVRGTQPLWLALYLYIWYVFCVNLHNQIEFVTLIHMYSSLKKGHVLGIFFTLTKMFML